MRLSDETIEAACYEGKCTVGKGGRKRWSVHILWEEGDSGLGLRISSTGKKSFVAAYRSGGRKRTRTLGRVGEMTLSEARERAAALRGAPRDEPPPPAKRGAESEEAAVETPPRTVAELAEAYLEQHLKVHAVSSFAEQRLIKGRIRPLVGGAQLSRITRADLAQLRIKFRTLYPRDAARLTKLVNELFAWASERGHWPVGAGGERPEETASAAAVDARPPEVADPPAAKPRAPRRSAAELREALQSSEEEREALTLRIEELSKSGGQMMGRLSALAADRARLEGELAKVREERQSDSAKAWPRAAKDEVVTLRRQVDELTERAERLVAERRKMRARLESKALGEQSLARELEAVDRLRSDQAAELERLRSATAEPPPTPPTPVEEPPPRRRPPWVAAAAATAGAIVGALLTYLATSGSVPEEATVGEPPREEAEAPAAMASPPPSVAAAVEPPPPVATAVEPPPPAPLAPAAPDYAAVEETVRQWASAWSAQRVDDYLSFYGDEFRPPRGSSRSEWEEQRRARLARPSVIRVTLGPLSQQVLTPERVGVSFDQAYWTESYSDETRKSLVLAWSDGRWTIVEERVQQALAP